MKNSFDIPSLEGTESLLVICATTRLAQFLQTKFGQRMASQDVRQWQSLNAKTMDQWFGEIAEELLLRGSKGTELLNLHVLTSLEEQLLFEQIIEEDLTGGGDLFDISALAENAVEANQIATIWALNLEGSYASKEQLSFIQWRQRFQQQCDAHGWIDEARYKKSLLQLLHDSTVNLPRVVVFAGFDRVTPIESQLERILAERGVKLGNLHDVIKPETIQVLSFPDFHSEIEAAAVWVERILHINPKSSVGIVVPNLDAHRNTVQDIFDRVLAPVSFRASAVDNPKAYNMSLGLSLTEYPIIGAAFELLSLMVDQGHVEQARFSQLLRSPFWSSGWSEMDARSRIDTELRQGVAPKASLHRYERFLKAQLSRMQLSAPGLMAHCAELEKTTTAFKKTYLPSTWAELLKQSLNACGWLAEYALSSHEFQTRQAFNEQVRLLGSLDAVIGEITASQAVAYLRQICAKRVFQAQTLGAPNVQIVGILEATGLQFDALWVMGMNDHIWPPPARPNPLLSAAQQRQFATPNASANVQLDFALNVHQRLSHSGKTITYSCARTEGASELRPSSLLDMLSIQKMDGPESASWISQIANHGGSALAAPIDDAFAPPVAEGEHVQGGTWLLRAQAICPAWAYYQFRLGASKLKEPVEGLDASKRGSLVHDALECFWNAVVGSKQLIGMGHERRADAIAKAVDQALSNLEAKPEQETLKAKFRSLERQRVIKLLKGWLDLELTRGMPFTVIESERKVSIDIHGIAVNMRIDRIDQLEDGRLLVIDYKTGASIDTKNWASERITEPQLPIYAAIAQPDEGQVAGVVFAKVLLNSPAFSGLAETAGLLPKLNGLDSTPGRKLFPASLFPDWSSVLLHWKTRIEAIADEVKAGEASVRYGNEKDLRYCDVRPLLRLSERQIQLETTAVARSHAQ